VLAVSAEGSLFIVDFSSLPRGDGPSGEINHLRTDGPAAQIIAPFAMFSLRLNVGALAIVDSGVYFFVPRCVLCV